MNVAAVQFRARRDDPSGSEARLAELASEAARDADLVVLPETAVSGYVFLGPDAARAASEPADGGRLALWSSVAAEARTWLVVGFVEQDGPRLFNSARVIDRAGRQVDVYRKTLLFEEDERWAAPGRGAYRVHDTSAGTFTVGICMDLNDPRFVGWARRAQADAIAFPTAWIDEGLDIWPYWAHRISGTGSVLVAANTWGQDRHLPFLGRSAVVGERRVHAGLPPEGDAVVRAVVPSYSTVSR